MNNIQRRNFLKTSFIALGGLLIFPKGLFSKNDGPIIGHGTHRYRVDHDWALLNPSITKLKDCHEMVIDKQGRLILLTNETANNVIIFDRSGKIIDTWGHEFPGGHGLTLVEEGGEEFLFMTDHNRHQVYKATLDGKIIMTLDWPEESGVYKNDSFYNPTETAIGPNGDIYIADGYGAQYISQYDANGNFIRVFGEPGKVWAEARAKWNPKRYETPDPNKKYPDSSLSNAHGITLDTRDADNPTLLVTSRQDNMIKRFTLDGTFIENIELPGAYVNRAVIKGEYLYASVLRSDRPLRDFTGFVTILDKNNRVISNPGGTEPKYKRKKLQQIQQAEKIFVHPHDVCVDNDENVYIPQWNSGRTFPVKLERV